MKVAPTGSRKASGGLLVAVNSIWQLVAFGARFVSGLAAVILIARQGGPSELGVYQFALTLSAMFSFAVGIGLSNLMTREVARRPDQARLWLESGVMVSLITGAVITVLLAGGVRVAGQSATVVMAVTLAGAALAFDTAGRLQFATFKGLERMGLEALATCIQEGAFLIAIGAVVVAHGGVQAVMVSYLGSRMLGALVGLFISGRVLGGMPKPNLHLTFLRPILRTTVPFALDDALSSTYIRIDTVLLGFMKGSVAVGLYQAGTNLVLYLNVLARMVNLALLPRMSKAWPNLGRLGRYRDASLFVLGAIGVPLAVASFILAGDIFEFLYGSKFAKAVLTYQLLILIIPIRMQGHTLGTALTAAQRQTRRTAAVAGAAVVNLGLNLYFIPRWSYLGAAITTDITETALFITYALLLRREAGPSKLVRGLVFPALACVPMGVVLVALRDAPLLLALAAGGLAYLVAALIFSMAVIPAEARRSPRKALRALVLRVAR